MWEGEKHEVWGWIALNKWPLGSYSFYYSRLYVNYIPSRVRVSREGNEQMSFATCVNFQRYTINFRFVIALKVPRNTPRSIRGANNPLPPRPEIDNLRFDGRKNADSARTAAVDGLRTESFPVAIESDRTDSLNGAPYSDLRKSANSRTTYVAGSSTAEKRKGVTRVRQPLQTRRPIRRSLESQCLRIISNSSGGIKKKLAGDFTSNSLH